MGGLMSPFAAMRQAASEGFVPCFTAALSNTSDIGHGQRILEMLLTPVLVRGESCAPAPENARTCSHGGLASVCMADLIHPPTLSTHTGLHRQVMRAH